MAYGKNVHEITIIKRRNPSELDMTVNELLQRGYEVISRGKYKTRITQDVHWAKLRFLNAEAMRINNDKSDVE